VNSSSQKKTVALTGGIGSGKSLVARLFEEWGAATVDADILAREVVAPGSLGLKKLLQEFPNAPLLLADGSLNRSKLGEIIFNDVDCRHRVEAILHPLIRERWLAELKRLRSTPTKLIVYVVPLYFESKQRMAEIESVVLVTAPEELKITRIMARDGFPRDIAELRLHAQANDADKIPLSDYVIVNDSTIAAATERAREVFSKLVS
jgi:dephospho-CoA kinase